MRCERFALTDDPAALALELRRLAPGGESVQADVAEIVGTVRTSGDQAVLDYTRRLDTSGREPRPLRVTDDELESALEQLDPKLQDALSQAIRQVTRGAELALGAAADNARVATHTLRFVQRPVARAAVYVPGGRAPYLSTVVMGVVPARCAAVHEIVVCSPPGENGDIHPAVLGACRLAGATSVYRMGGAQAIAALAYGTESIDPVDVIVGPGNLYVQEAKRQVYGQVGVDGFAGPSDLVVIAERGVDAQLVALDLMAQAEHGAGTLVIAISDSESLLGVVQEVLHGAPDTGAIAALVEVDDVRGALAISNAFAPEHLQLIGGEAEGLADDVINAGCVFVGPFAGTAFGDYIAGSNHILPTDGTARFASALSPLHFLRGVTQVRITDPDALAAWGATIARAEGFELHARSMEQRIRQNRPDGG